MPYGLKMILSYVFVLILILILLGINIHILVSSTLFFTLILYHFFYINYYVLYIKFISAI